MRTAGEAAEQKDVSRLTIAAGSQKGGNLFGSRL